jgi:opacity protein-like surface antigen
MKKIIAIAALSAALSTSAFAAGNNAYVFADIGSASFSNTTTGNITFPNPGSFGIGAGYQFNSNVAAELGYTAFGDSSVTVVNTGVTAKLKTSSLHAAVVGTYPFNPQFSAIGKLGVSSNKVDGSNSAGFAYNASKTSLYYAVGGQYNINQQFAIRAQYENVGKFNTTTPTMFGQDMSASTFSIGGVYNF